MIPALIITLPFQRNISLWHFGLIRRRRTWSSLVQVTNGFFAKPSPQTLLIYCQLNPQWLFRQAIPSNTADLLSVEPTMAFSPSHPLKHCWFIVSWTHNGFFAKPSPQTLLIYCQLNPQWLFRQAIPSNTADLLSVEPTMAFSPSHPLKHCWFIVSWTPIVEQISIEFETKYVTLHWIKCIWKYRLQY